MTRDVSQIAALQAMIAAQPNPKISRHIGLSCPTRLGGRTQCSVSAPTGGETEAETGGEATRGGGGGSEGAGDAREGDAASVAVGTP